MTRVSGVDKDELRPELPPVLGMVLEEDRGSLPYSMVHGEPMVRCAALALEEARIEPIDPDSARPVVLDLLERAEGLVLHDSLCPMTAPEFLARCANIAVADDVVVVGYRSVTDTVKRLEEGRVGATVDREGLRALASPVAMPARVVRQLPDDPLHDLAALVSWLVQQAEPVEWIEAPAEGRRVSSRDDVRLLEALTARSRF